MENLQENNNSNGLKKLADNLTPEWWVDVPKFEAKEYAVVYPIISQPKLSEIDPQQARAQVGMLLVWWEGMIGVSKAMDKEKLVLNTEWILKNWSDYSTQALKFMIEYSIQQKIYDSDERIDIKTYGSGLNPLYITEILREASKRYKHIFYHLQNIESVFYQNKKWAAEKAERDERIKNMGNEPDWISGKKVVDGVTLLTEEDADKLRFPRIGDVMKKWGVGKDGILRKG